jgi:hypothetical protein
MHHITTNPQGAFMLQFVKNAFRSLFMVFLWLNLFGSIITGCVIGSKGGGGWIIFGLIGGVTVGFLTNILWGGFVAAVLCIEDKIDAFDNKYATLLNLLGTINSNLGRLDRENALVSNKSTVTEKDIARTGQEMNAIQEKLLSTGSSELSDGHTGTDQKPELNAVYDAVITRVVDLGAFAEYLPGRTGLISIMEIAQERVAKVDDVLKVGDKVRVKVIGFERSGSAKLSIKALL